MSDSVRARGVSSRIVSDKGRVEGEMVCHVEGDGLAIVPSERNEETAGGKIRVGGREGMSRAPKPDWVAECLSGCI